MQIEQWCDMMGGHAYGNSYQIPQGGQFMENMDSYGLILNNGFPKPVVVTEHGSVASHSDLNDMDSGQHTDAANFDRNMRSMIAATDRFIYHAPWFNQLPTTDCHLFLPISNWVTADPLNMQERPGYTDTGITQESRLTTYRRLALAYATHGAPLKYTITNAPALVHKRVYVRPINTATIPALPGSGATSNKVLLNFVNFETTPQIVQSRIYLPANGSWSGYRYGPGTTLSAARSSYSQNAAPYLDFTETLGARESVQYILSQP